jgi:hypothetical protein
MDGRLLYQTDIPRTIGSFDRIRTSHKIHRPLLIIGGQIIERGQYSTDPNEPNTLIFFHRAKLVIKDLTKHLVTLEYWCEPEIHQQLEIKATTTVATLKSFGEKLSTFIDLQKYGKYKQDDSSQILRYNMTGNSVEWLVEDGMLHIERFKYTDM